jgi:hypothetical protein
MPKAHEVLRERVKRGDITNARQNLMSEIALRVGSGSKGRWAELSLRINMLDGSNRPQQARLLRPV